LCHFLTLAIFVNGFSNNKTINIRGRLTIAIAILPIFTRKNNEPKPT
jgi:hypothetical protein